MEKKFKYDAFISYRHTELDKFVAGSLHKKLESYHLPKNVAQKIVGQKTRIERVFRDKEELQLTNNLEEPIIAALQESEWLIVVCSPRLKESLWCKKEIETFISLHGREHVLAVLIEGEPKDSFPEELLYETREVVQPDGTVVTERVMLEPLAADFRGKNKREVKKAMDKEIIRVLAAMFGLAYDDLRQRHKERKLRRLVTTSLGIGAVCLAVGAYSTITAIRINDQKERIEAQSEQILAQTEEIRQQSETLEKKNEEITKQNEEITRQNEEMAKKNEEITKQNEEITKKNDELALHQANALSELAERYLSEGKKDEAKKLALQVLTEQDGICLPYMPKAQQVLTSCLSVYDAGGVFRADYQLSTVGLIGYTKETKTRDVLAIYDAAGFLRVYDMNRREEILLLDSDSHGADTEKECTFWGEDWFVYLTVDREVCIYNYREKCVVAEIDVEDFPYYVYGDDEGNYLVVDTYDSLLVYNRETLEVVVEITHPEGVDSGMVRFLSDGKLVYVEERNTSESYLRDESTVCVWDLKTAQPLVKCDLGIMTANDIKELDGVVYVLSAEHYNSLMGCNTHVTAISLTTGEKLWSTVFEGQYPEKKGLYLREESEQLLCITDGCLYVITRSNGEARLVSGKGMSVLNVLFSGTEDYFLFMENGDLFLLVPEQQILYDICEQFACVTKDNTTISFYNDGIWVLAQDDDKITFYSAPYGTDVLKLEQKAENRDNRESVYGDEALKIAAEMGSDRPEVVREAVFSEDERYCMILYYDKTLDIFDTESKMLLSTQENIEGISWCKGPDANGWIYLGGGIEGYILNEQKEVIARINHLHAVDTEKRKVYVRLFGEDYEIPVYSLEELLNLATKQ